MIEEDRPGPHARILKAALDAFLSYGFHAVKPSEIEAATGEAWDTLTERFGDKEALFLAAAQQGLTDGSVATLGKRAKVLEMLYRLERVNGNPRLRAIHKQTLDKVRNLAE